MGVAPGRRRSAGRTSRRLEGMHRCIDPRGSGKSDIQILICGHSTPSRRFTRVSEIHAKSNMIIASSRRARAGVGRSCPAGARLKAGRPALLKRRRAEKARASRNKAQRQPTQSDMTAPDWAQLEAADGVRFSWCVRCACALGGRACTRRRAAASARSTFPCG